MWGDVGRCGEMWGDMGRYGEIWLYVGRYDEIWGDVGRDCRRRTRVTPIRMRERRFSVPCFRDQKSTAAIHRAIPCALSAARRYLYFSLCPPSASSPSSSTNFVDLVDFIDLARPPNSEEPVFWRSSGALVDFAEAPTKLGPPTPRPAPLVDAGRDSWPSRCDSESRSTRKHVDWYLPLLFGSLGGRALAFARKRTPSGGLPFCWSAWAGQYASSPAEIANQRLRHNLATPPRL